MAKSPTTPLSAERQALQAAFDAKLARDAEQAAVQAAFDRSVDAVYDAIHITTEIERDIRERPQNAARRMVYSGLNEEPEPEPVRELRAKLADAESDAEDAQRVRAELRRQPDSFETGWNPTTGKLRAAAAAVLRSETADMVEKTVSRIEALTVELAQARATGASGPLRRYMSKY